MLDSAGGENYGPAPSRMPGGGLAWFRLAGSVLTDRNLSVMQITVTGHQIDVGDALRDHAQSRLSDRVAKYFDQGMVGHVAFSHEGPLFRTHIQVKVGKGLAWESYADNADIYASFNEAAERLDKQLRRQKRKLRDHHKGGEDAATTEPS